jgi:hypothetical protein
LKRKLGFRTLLDVIPLDPSLVRGSHGRVDLPEDRQPLLIAQQDPGDNSARMPCTAVRDVILRLIFDS